MGRSKVFGIGLNKTGTTTLGTCLSKLGYNHVSCRPDLMRQHKAGNLEKIFEVSDAHDSFEDWPWPLLYKEMADRYPDAKFILTERVSPEKWLKSLKNHALFTKPLWTCRKAAYGYHYPQHSEQAHLDFYQHHREEVLAFFAERNEENRLRVLCWETDKGWPELCEFLGEPVVDGPLPHSNATNERSASGFEMLNRAVIGLKGVLAG